MKITFLGTGSGCPTRTRNMSSIGLQLPQKGALWLFDCGEGTQHQVLRSPLRLSQLEKVFLTHLHGDHLFGLPGLLASRSLQGGGTTPVTLYGPAGLEAFVRVSLDRSETRLTYPIRVETIREGPVWEDESFQVVCAPMEHRIEAFGFAVVEKDLPGHFDADAAAGLGIPAGPLFGRLKSGETIALPDGRTICGADIVGPPRPGRKVVYCGDTSFTSHAVALARDADLLIHEATHLGGDRALADRAAHSTAAMAAEVARQAGVGMLILTHFSPRYESAAGSRLTDLLTEAQAIFPNTRLAYDFLSYDVPARNHLR